MITQLNITIGISHDERKKYLLLLEFILNSGWIKCNINPVLGNIDSQNELIIDMSSCNFEDLQEIYNILKKIEEGS